MSPDYTFRTVWRVAGTVGEVRGVLADGESLARWWPSVYLDVRPLAPGGPDGVGARAELHTTGWLPYTLRWTLEITEPVTDEGFTLTAEGDLAGSGVWRFEQDGPEVEISYDWQVRAGKLLLRRLTWLLRPVFAANHHWAMRRGEQSLALELRRRRARSQQELVRVPVPPPPSLHRRR